MAIVRTGERESYFFDFFLLFTPKNDEKSENFEALFLDVRHFINFLSIQFILIRKIATFV